MSVNQAKTKDTRKSFEFKVDRVNHSRIKSLTETVLSDKRLADKYRGTKSALYADAMKIGLEEIAVGKRTSQLDSIDGKLNEIIFHQEMNRQAMEALLNVLCLLNKGEINTKSVEGKILEEQIINLLAGVNPKGWDMFKFSKINLELQKLLDRRKG